MLFYVAGPYSARTEKACLANVERACRAGKELIGLGHACFIPHLSHWWDKICPMPYEVWVALDLEILARCDAMLYLGSSPGADTERMFAECHGIPIYEHVTEIPPADTVKVLRPVTCGEVAGGSGGGQCC